VELLGEIPFLIGMIRIGKPSQEVIIKMRTKFKINALPWACIEGGTVYAEIVLDVF